MDQPMLVDSGRETDSQNDELATPSRAHKRLFLSSCNSSKRNLFREDKEGRRDAESVSDAESDLGPMSPLALTDRSSCDSSPGRQFISPLATPEKSPVIPLTAWNCLNPGSISPFSSLRRVTRSARFSPRRVIFPNSPKSRSSSSSQNTRAESMLTSPDAADDTIMPDEIVPETPGKESDFDDQQSYVAETPQKEEYTEQRLITPAGSVCKNIPIPRIHRRKSLGALDFNERTSPEIKQCILKRHREGSLSPFKTKFQKTDEFSLAPKARAALFQERKITDEKERGFTLTPKSFYGSNDKSRRSFGPNWREPQLEVKKRRSLPAYNSHTRAVKRHKKGEINCGVGHGIRRPKPKRQPLPKVSAKKEKQNENVNSKANESSKENLNPQNERAKTDKDKTLTPEVDNSKKFFKFKSNQNAVCTVNDKINLRIALNQKDAEHANKKAKLDSISFDTADLSVDEPAVEESLEQTKVANILKILEDDWADDDYDTMATAQATSRMITHSPKKACIPLKNLTMSPGSELSSMTSIMNIEDSPGVVNKNAKNISLSTELPPRKFYPLFAKGYSSNFINT